MIANKTNNIYRIHRYGLVAHLSSAPDSNVKTINTVFEFKVIGLQDLNAPGEYWSDMENLVMKNHDLFVNTDSDLGNCSCAKMKIDARKLEPF